ncbi:MAG: hypothetical protein ACOYYS_19055 [Chloroflexota bacterium]
MSRVFAFLFFGFLLAACHPKTVAPARTPSPLATSTARPTRTVTPEATRTPTREPTLTRTSRPTRTPALSPSPTPTPVARFGETPPHQANRYRLKPWDGSEAWELVIIDEIVLPRQDGQSYDHWLVWPQIRQTLLREITARFPNSPVHADARARLIVPAYDGFGSYQQYPLEPFRRSLEDALNAEGSLEISVENLNAIIARILLVEIHDDYPYVDVFPADNVLADGAPGWVLGLNVPGPAGAALALSGKPGDYRLVSAREEWRLFAWSEQRVFNADLNANGVPEIAIRDSYWGTGMSHFCGETLELYEWNGRQLANLTPNLTTYANTDSGACLDFTFTGEPGGLQRITTGNLIGSGCYDGDYGDWHGVGSLVVQRHYAWNGAYYAPAGEEVEPLERAIPEEWPLINRCTLSWVNEAGVENDLAFRLLPTLVAETDPALMDGFAKEFGPAYLDYFRFKLGAWYAVRGQQAQALALLTQVRDHPFNDQFGMASQLADAFLQAYSSTGVYAGCVAANALLDIYQFPSENMMILGMELDLGSMKETWGFGEYQWLYGGGSVFSGASGRNDPLNLCSTTAAFRSTVRSQRFASSQELTRWLDRQQIPYTGLQEGDANDDGRSDWLILLGTGKEQSWHLWALLDQAENTLPVWVADIQRSTGNIPTTWNTFSPNPSGSPLNVYQWTDGVLIFRIIFPNGNAGVEIVHQSDAYRDEVFLGFTVNAASEAGLVEGNDAETLRMLVVGDEAWQTDWYVLGWDPAQNGLRVIDSPQHDQEQKIRAAESLLFEKANPAGALEILQPLLNEENRYLLLDEDAKTYDSLPLVQPYLQYLLGLAYEMSADERSAIAAYWSLWQDFPLHPFSYVVQQKLEEE